MILVTVGAQMPFDRLVKAVDAWAGAEGRDDVVAQIGETSFRPSHLEWKPFLDPMEFERHLDLADAIVAHAGTGSLLGALTRGKPILVMPRRCDLRETRNDHQVATCRHFGDLPTVVVAADETEVPAALGRLLGIPATEPSATAASPELLDAVRAFVLAARDPREERR